MAANATAGHDAVAQTGLSPLSVTLWKQKAGAGGGAVSAEDASARLAWKNLTVVVSSRKGGEARRVLDGLTGYAESGTLTALMGPSGSGKSTLLDALASRLGPGALLSGSVLLNGRKAKLSYGTALLLLATATVVAADGTGSFASLQQIKSVGEDDHVQSLGRFAISENARAIRQRRGVARTAAAAASGRSSGSLTFVGVTKAYKHWDEVSGMLYYLKVAAKDSNGKEQSYDAAVLVEQSRKSKAETLLSFGPSRPRPPV